MDFLFKKTNIMYNLTDGGDGPSGRKPSTESRKKMSEAQLGDKSWKSKLTEANVIEIKILLRDKIMTQKEIAKKFNVGYITINSINKEKRWWWVLVPGFESRKTRYESKPTNAKLTVSQVQEIKTLLKNSGLTQKEIAEKFGVTVQSITLINTGKRWANIQ